MRRRFLGLALLATAGLAGCGDDTRLTSITAPTSPQMARSVSSSEDDPTFVQYTATTPPATRDTSFWAVRGQDRRLEIYYESTIPGEKGEKLMKFRVREGSLRQRPDGSLIAFGDSVLISVRVDTEEGLVFDFQPSGLRFSTYEPAEIDISFSLADQDLNGDGVVDRHDKATERQLAIWQQEATLDPWMRLPSMLTPPEDKVSADVLGFTRFALASN